MLIDNTFIKPHDFNLKIKFEAILQGVEFAFGYSKDIEIIEPTESISIIKKKALEVADLY